MNLRIPTIGSHATNAGALVIRIVCVQLILYYSSARGHRRILLVNTRTAYSDHHIYALISVYSSKFQESAAGLEGLGVGTLICGVQLLGVQGLLGFVVWGLGFRLQGSGFRVWGSGLGMSRTYLLAFFSFAGTESERLKNQAPGHESELKSFTKVVWINAMPDFGVSENRGPQYSTLDSRIPINYKGPQDKGTPNFRILSTSCTRDRQGEDPKAQRNYPETPPNLLYRLAHLKP